MTASFELHEVGGGVWAAVAPGTAGPAVSNAAIVDLGGKTLVVDTFMTRHAADELAAAVRRLTGRDAFLVVNSHWHSDHVRGNGAFAGAPIVGTEAMRELIVADAPATAEEFASRVAEIRNRATQLGSAGMLALADAMAAETDGHRIPLPDLLIGDRLDVVGERSATILGYGRGHTDSDLFVHVPDAAVLVAGDLVWSGVHPKTDDGHPADWVGVLERLAALQPALVVPGHGPPGGAALLDAMTAYIRRVAELVAAVAAGEVGADDAPPPPGTEQWQDAARFRQGLSRLAKVAEQE